MTEEVAEACLVNNYIQTLAISLGEHNGVAGLGFLNRLMRSLERSGLLDRTIEFLPEDIEIEDRRAAGEALTRPELAVLLAYAKIDLYDALITSEVPDDPFFTGNCSPISRRRCRSGFPMKLNRTGCAEKLLPRG